MSVISEIIQSRRLPDLLKFENGAPVTAESWEARRLEMLEILKREEYGYAPPAPAYVKSEIISEKTDYAGKAKMLEVKLTMPTDGGDFSFTVMVGIPKKASAENKVPTFVYINFRPEIPDKYLPAEDIIDAGFAFVRIYCNDITLNGKDDFKQGIAPYYDREKYNWGKISMWAWSASRVFDYLETTDWADLSRVGVSGHSRLGKTSLWCAANDTRFAIACANNSGCSGDAITRDKKGEHIVDITRNFPFWFCENYKKYINNEDAMPFDQHFLVAALCPRKVALGAALDDEWADPESQYLSACEASRAWELLGLTGFVHPDRLPVPGDNFPEGNVTYHLRAGAHFHSTEDWRYYLTRL